MHIFISRRLSQCLICEFKILIHRLVDMVFRSELEAQEKSVA